MCLANTSEPANCCTVESVLASLSHNHAVLVAPSRTVTVAAIAELIYQLFWNCSSEGVEQTVDAKSLNTVITGWKC